MPLSKSPLPETSLKPKDKTPDSKKLDQTFNLSLLTKSSISDLNKETLITQDLTTEEETEIITTTEVITTEETTELDNLKEEVLIEEIKDTMDPETIATEDKEIE
jgi:hypothetical protein